MFMSIAQTECSSAFSKGSSFMPDLLIGSVTKTLELKSSVVITCPLHLSNFIIQVIISSAPAE